MRHIPLSLLGLLASLSACVPDYGPETSAGPVLDGGGDTAGADDGDDGASDGADGSDGGDGADGTDDGGPPSWIGVNPLVYELETPRGDLLCEGTMDLELSADGEGVGYDECVLLEGPGEGREMGVKLVVQVADVASEDSRLSGEATLTRAEGDEMGSGALDGVVEGGAFDLAFEVDGIGPDGDRTLLGVAFSP